ncbi:hypothetical protein ACIBEJ_00890 [Nonomuraea sp. NPDC050790]|uniref:hypothetical protein n=1 Tax=Nonomuraea sp. NPDC050790 TaxID=3364371 RepID=UPI0037ADB5A0
MNEQAGRSGRTLPPMLRRTIVSIAAFAVIALLLAATAITLLTALGMSLGAGMLLAAGIVASCVDLIQAGVRATRPHWVSLIVLGALPLASIPIILFAG